MQSFRKERDELSQELQEQIWKNEVALEMRVSKTSEEKTRVHTHVLGVTWSKVQALIE